MKKVLLCLSFCLVQLLSVAHTQKFTTLTYYQDDTLKLELDLFLPQGNAPQKRALVLFEHGGGFSSGSRKSGHAFSEYLAQQGYASASISYTLYMKGRNYTCNGALPDKIKAFQYAANHFWLATAYFLQHAQKYQIDPSKIFLAGSSAGAEAALHAAFWNYKAMNLYPKTPLPSTFKYAGIVSGAGAIMDLNLITAQNMVPVLVFHGSADRTVPYATAAHHYCPSNSSNWLMLFGSLSIYEHLVRLNGSTTLYTYCGAAHSAGNELFNKTQQPVVDFLNQVLAGQKTQQHVIVPSASKEGGAGGYSFCQ